MDKMNFTVEELYEELKDIVERGRGRYDTGIPATDIIVRDHKMKVEIVDVNDLIDEAHL